LKRIFAGIATIITVLLILTSFACIAMPFANSANSDFEINPPTAGWQLIVTGFVENSFNLSWTEFLALPKTTVAATLICVDYPNAPMNQGNWTGVQLRTLLEEAGPTTYAVKVAFFASDGYSTARALNIWGSGRAEGTLMWLG
jgi:DMSO/TMAO reductase YedYZ molybdopterin-dependent catalytic subunit